MTSAGGCRVYPVNSISSAVPDDVFTSPAPRRFCDVTVAVRLVPSLCMESSDFAENPGLIS